MDFDCHKLWTGFLELLTALGWPITGPVTALILAWYFREEIKLVLRSIEYFKAGGIEVKGRGIDLKEKIEKLPESGGTVFSQEQIVSEFKKVTHLKEKDIRDHLKQIEDHLKRNGVSTLEMLRGLVASTEVHQRLTAIYRDIFPDRPLAEPYDPEALANWGSELFVTNCNFTVELSIRQRLTDAEHDKAIERTNPNVSVQLSAARSGWKFRLKKAVGEDFGQITVIELNPEQYNGIKHFFPDSRYLYTYNPHQEVFTANLVRSAQ